MKYIITAYTTLIVFLLSVFVCMNIMNAQAREAEAKEYKAQIVAEIENSNFNEKVIDACISQAQMAGYELQVINCRYDENYNIQTAEIILTYAYELPIFGISQIKTTRGIAR